jgi:hypothetical protein
MPTVKVQESENAIKQDQTEYAGVIVPKLVWLQDGVPQDECPEEVIGDAVDSEELILLSKITEGNLVAIRTPELEVYPLRMDSVVRETDVYKVTLSKSTGEEIILDFQRGGDSVIISEKSNSGTKTYNTSREKLEVCPLLDKAFSTHYDEMEQHIVERL